MVQTRKILYVFCNTNKNSNTCFDAHYPYILLMMNGHVNRTNAGEEAGECLVEAAYLNVLLKRYHKAATYYRDAAEMYERCNLYGIDAISRTLPRHIF